MKCLTPKTDGQCSLQFLLQKVYLLVILFFSQHSEHKKQEAQNA